MKLSMSDVKSVHRFKASNKSTNDKAVKVRKSNNSKRVKRRK